MAPPRLLHVLPCLVAALVAISSCHRAGCREGDQACAALSDGSSTAGGSESSSSGGSTVTSTTADPTSGSTSTGDGTTAELPVVCGDGVVGGDEACDDGNQDELDACRTDCTRARCGDGLIRTGFEGCDDGNEDDSDDCTNNCQVARCGDGVVHAGQEQCDAGLVNSDLIYGGCTSKCVPGARCGDGKLNGPEDCDDLNTEPTDGCLEGCIEARSCKQVLERVPGTSSGPYRLWPELLGGDVNVTVWCDMDSDGGGYTFLKVDTQVIGASDKGAQAAELACQTYGMHLLVPRTQAHVKSAHSFATTPNVVPLGGGKVPSGIEYLSILSVYPRDPMATCAGKGLNAVDCPGWRAWDDQPFWVTDVPVLGEPSEDHCDGCSMLYKWKLDGSLKSYTTFPAGDGASSYRFICDVADKF